MTKHPFEQLRDWIYSACPQDAEALLMDARLFGTCTIKTNADGTTTRVAPENIWISPSHSPTPSERETNA